jgi:hypothetical protein
MTSSSEKQQVGEERPKVWMQCPGCWSANLIPAPTAGIYIECDECAEKLTVIDLRDGPKGALTTDRGSLEFPATQQSGDGLEGLTKLEIAGTLAAINAVADSAPDGPPEPLVTCSQKLSAALSARASGGRGE